MKFKNTVYASGFCFDAPGMSKDWQGVFSKMPIPRRLTIYALSSNKTPRGPAYKRMVRNGII